jgi:predicted enzyme related to lactoylglutathione lyase
MPHGSGPSNETPGIFLGNHGRPVFLSGRQAIEKSTFRGVSLAPLTLFHGSKSRQFVIGRFGGPHPACPVARIGKEPVAAILPTAGHISHALVRPACASPASMRHTVTGTASRLLLPVGHWSSRQTGIAGGSVGIYFTADAMLSVWPCYGCEPERHEPENSRETVEMMTHDKRSNSAVWFEIPATDFERAVTFYETIMAVKLKREDMDAFKLGIFPYSEPATSGCVIAGGEHRSGKEGVIIYLNCDHQLDAVIGRVEAAGGAVLMPNITLPDGMGVFTHILDSEGNRIGLHAVT